MNFIGQLEDYFGPLGIFDEDNVGREEIYWRLILGAWTWDYTKRRYSCQGMDWNLCGTRDQRICLCSGVAPKGMALSLSAKRRF